MRLLPCLSLLLLVAGNARAADEDDEFLVGEGSRATPGETRHQWTWPVLARFDPDQNRVQLSWPDRTGEPEESVSMDDVIRLERARPFEAAQDELFMLLADGRRILVARGADVSAQVAITAAVTGLPVKDLPPGEGHFDAPGQGSPPRVVVGGGGGVEIRGVATTDVAGSNRAEVSTAATVEEDDPALAGEGGGELDRHEIDIVIKQKMGLIRQCYTRELRRNPQLAGNVVVRFVIARDGTVKYARLRSSTLGNPVVEDCVVEELQAARFPRPRGQGTVIVSYPFLFSGG